MKLLKAILSLALTVSILCGVCAFAESVDLSDYTDAELETLKARIIRELEQRSPVTETVIDFPVGGKTMLVNEGGIKIYLTGQSRSTWQLTSYEIGVAFENDSDMPLSAWAENVKLNGWNHHNIIISSTLESGEKQAGDIDLSPSEAMVSELTEMEDLTFTISLDDKNYNSVREYGPFRLVFHFVGD